jgi:hypothetical protein
MLLRDAGRWLVTAVVGIMLAAAPATAFAAQANEFGVGNRAFNNRAVPATFETTNDSHTSKLKKIDDDDDDRGGDWDFGFGFGWGNPWWGGWYGSPYWGWGPSQNYYYYPAPQHKTGQVKIETSRRNAKVYIDGAYAGRVKNEHKFELDPGRYQIEIRTANGQKYDTNVYVLRGRTVYVTPNFGAMPRTSS